jgi:DNA-nicking Smr family endonuclease
VKRPLRPEELHIWARVAATVRPSPGQPLYDPSPALERTSALAASSPVEARAVPPPPRRPLGALEAIEPGRRHRLMRGRDALGPRLDLHGLSQDEARVALFGFLERAAAEGWRAVLVITGKGLRGDGVLRRRVPEWLAEPTLRSRVAGVSEAHHRHGGEGALYVALKRQAKS